jgi:hypothetical protein
VGDIIVVEVDETVAVGEDCWSADAGVGVWAVAPMASTNDAMQDSNRIFINVPLGMRRRPSDIWIQEFREIFRPTATIKKVASRPLLAIISSLSKLRV